MEKIICAFTGHRPKSFPWKYDETALDCVLLKEVLAAQIKALADRGATVRYAQELRRKIIIINPVTRTLSKLHQTD